MILSNEEKVRQALEVRPYMLIMMEHFEFVLKFFILLYDWKMLFRLLIEMVVMGLTLIFSPIVVPVIAYQKYKKAMNRVGNKKLNELPICFNCTFYHFEQCCFNESIPVPKHPASACNEYRKVERLK